MGFECFDGAFSGVVTVVSWGHELKIYFCFFLDVFDEGFGDLIVHSDDFRMETVFSEMVVGFFKSSFVFGGFSGFDGDSICIVCIIVIHN